MFLVVLFATSVLQLMGISAYPALLPFIYSPRHSRDVIKQTHMQAPQIDRDVFELDRLRGLSNDESPSPAVKRQSDPVVFDAIVVPHIEPTAVVAYTSEQPLPSSVEGPSPANTEVNIKQRLPLDSSLLPSQPINTKPFHGAARLAFGQNPDLVPSSTTPSSTISMPTITRTTTLASSTKTTAPETKPIHKPNSTTEAYRNAEAIDDSADISDNEDSHVKAEPIPTPNDLNQPEQSNEKPYDLLEKEAYEESSSHNTEATKINQRRSSVFHGSQKTADSLLRNSNGQYSSFDMAQYVFWTGDEAGVARAVQELIDQNLITKENALKFLRDIRLGIEFLQRSYENRIYPAELRGNQLKRKVSTTIITTTTMKPSTTSTESTTTVKPSHYSQNEEAQYKLKSPQNSDLEETLRRLVLANKAATLNDEYNNHNLEELKSGNLDGTIHGNSLYNEYTLEEILYRLAKAMFVEALIHGTNDAQQELEKLMKFLEREGNIGLIPAKLQNKVLKILFSAYADTLNEHSDLSNLNANPPFYGLPLHIPNQKID